MLDVNKKKGHALKHGRRWLLLGACAALLMICAGALMLRKPQEPVTVEEPPVTYTELAEYSAADVARVAITLRSGERWTAIQQEGVLTLEEDPAYTISAESAQSLLNAVRVISFEEVLSDDPVEFSGRLEEFGLDVPRVVAEITYADGAVWVLRIGEMIHLEEANAYYMTIDGDPRLLALDKGTAENLMIEKALLHPVEQPTLHKARFDRITFADGAGSILAEWALQGDIGGNAQDRWMLMTPVTYPADGESIGNLLDNLSNIRLGAYVGEATPENLTAYGFDTPRFVISIHQAAGAIGTTGADGVYGVTDWPESTFTLTVGSAKNDAVDYVCVGDKIYISSHYSLNVFMGMDAMGTLSRYTVPVALGNLKQLTVSTQAGEQVYTLERTELVAENNDLVTAEDGTVLYETTCSLNGESIPYAGFEAAYNDLLRVSVSGSLPADWVPSEPVHTSFIFESYTGERYILELTRFDAMHDAVLLDGHALFYLIQGGMSFQVQ